MDGITLENVEITGIHTLFFLLFLFAVNQTWSQLSIDTPSGFFGEAFSLKMGINFIAIVIAVLQIKPENGTIY